MSNTGYRVWRRASHCGEPYMALSRTLVILVAIVFGLFAASRWPLHGDQLVSASTQEPAKVITILHTNDIHGHLMPWQGWEGPHRGQTMGGFATLATQRFRPAADRIMKVMGSTVAAQRGAPSGGLQVYGPGGPLAPMKACAEQFAQKTKIPVNVVGGPEAEWIGSAQRDADLVFGGAEYMLTAFDLRHPRFLDATTRVSLFDRSAGILVRTGNPKQIRSLKDLARNGIQIVDVNGAGQLGLWEDLAGRQGMIREIQHNIQISVESSADAIALWKARPELDAWITYESWYYRLRDMTELVRLPETERLYRGTPIAIAQRSIRKAEAAALIAHLQSGECHDVFRQWGWR